MFKLPSPQQLAPLDFPDLLRTQTYLQSKLLSNGLLPSLHVDTIDSEELPDGQLWQTIRSNMRDGNGMLLRPEGMNLSRYDLNPIVLYEHAQPIGKCLEIQRSTVKVRALIEYDMSSELGAEVYRMHKAGYLPAASVGSLPTNWKNVADGIDVYEWDLIEISKVAIPADYQAV